VGAFLLSRLRGKAPKGSTYKEDTCFLVSASAADRYLPLGCLGRTSLFLSRLWFFFLLLPLSVVSSSLLRSFDCYRAILQQDYRRQPAVLMTRKFGSEGQLLALSLLPFLCLVLPATNSAYPLEGRAIFLHFFHKRLGVHSAWGNQGRRGRGGKLCCG
jgi:hypothetical protein